MPPDDNLCFALTAGYQKHELQCYIRHILLREHTGVLEQLLCHGYLVATEGQEDCQHLALQISGLKIRGNCISQQLGLHFQNRMSLAVAAKAVQADESTPRAAKSPLTKKMEQEGLGLGIAETISEFPF